MSCMGTKLSVDGLHLKGKKVVCILTGTGLKDRDLTSDLGPSPPEGYAAELSNVERAMALV